MEGTLFDISKLATKSRSENGAEIRKRCQAVYIGQDLVLCRLLGKYRFYVTSTDVGFGAQVIMEGFWEIGVTEFVAKNVSPGMVVVDVGANFGYYTLLMADLVGPQGKVIAIEPNVPVAECLRKSVSVNGFSGRVRLDPRAIWEKSGETLTLRIPEFEAKNARIVAKPAPESGKPGRELKVQTLALDDLQVENVGFVKIDVEGAEEHVWRGMQKFMERNPNALILLEFNCSRCETPQKTLEAMAAMGKLRYIVRGGDLQVKETNPDEILKQPKIDWLIVMGRQSVK